MVSSYYPATPNELDKQNCTYSKVLPHVYCCNSITTCAGSSCKLSDKEVRNWEQVNATKVNAANRS